MQFLTFLAALFLFLASAVASPAPVLHLSSESVEKRQTLFGSPCEGYSQIYCCAKAADQSTTIVGFDTSAYNCIPTGTCTGTNRQQVYCCLHIFLDSTYKGGAGTLNCNPTSSA